MSYPKPRFILNRNEGIDTLHRNPGERCNTDDATDRETIDQATAMKMQMGGFARLCQHCWPPEDEVA